MAKILNHDLNMGCLPVSHFFDFMINYPDISAQTSLLSFVSSHRLPFRIVSSASGRYERAQKQEEYADFKYPLKRMLFLIVAGGTIAAGLFIGVFFLSACLLSPRTRSVPAGAGCSGS